MKVNWEVLNRLDTKDLLLSTIAFSYPKEEVVDESFYTEDGSYDIEISVKGNYKAEMDSEKIIESILNYILELESKLNRIQMIVHED